MTKKLIEALIDLHNAASAVQGDGHLYASLQHAAEVIGEAQRVENMPPALKAAARIKAGVYTYAVLETAAAELARLHPFEAAHQAWSDKTDWLQDGATPAELGVHRADVLRHRIEKLTKERDDALAVGDANARSGASWAAGVRELQEHVALLEARQKCQRMGLHQIAEPADTNLLLRLLSENADLRAQLEAVGAGGVQPLRATQAAHAAVAPKLDDAWKAWMLDGQPLARDKDGVGYHPALPEFDEDVRSSDLFAALGIELKANMAEYEMDSDAYEAMTENGLTDDGENYNAWEPARPDDEGWNLVAVFDTEDGPACWWMRAKPFETQRARERRAALSTQPTAAAVGDEPLAVRTAPNKIWLDLGDEEAGDCAFDDLQEVTWSSVNASGYGIEYVRAALATTPEACRTCNGYGLIGGFVGGPDHGGYDSELCPNCNQPAKAEVQAEPVATLVQYRYRGVGVSEDWTDWGPPQPSRVGMCESRNLFLHSPQTTQQISKEVDRLRALFEAADKGMHAEAARGDKLADALRGMLAIEAENLRLDDMDLCKEVQDALDALAGSPAKPSQATQQDAIDAAKWRFVQASQDHAVFAMDRGHGWYAVTDKAIDAAIQAAQQGGSSGT